MTVVRNGRVQEVPFDTQTEAFDLGDKRGVTLPTVAAREAGGGQNVNTLTPLGSRAYTQADTLPTKKNVLKGVNWCVRESRLHTQDGTTPGLNSPSDPAVCLGFRGRRPGHAMKLRSFTRLRALFAAKSKHVNPVAYDADHYH